MVLYGREYKQKGAFAIYSIERIKYFYRIYLHLNIFYYLCTRKSELLTTKLRMWRNW